MYKALNRNYDMDHDVYMDKNGSIHDHYIPFSMPIRARYCRDTGIYLEEENHLTRWIESNFNVDLKDYLENLSEASYGNVTEDTVIDEKNIFDYMAVSLEHFSFVRGWLTLSSSTMTLILTFTVWRIFMKIIIQHLFKS